MNSNTNAQKSALLQWFQPAVFPDNDKTTQATLLRFILFTLFFILTVYVPFRIIVTEQATIIFPPAFVLVIMSIGFFYLGLWQFVRLGYVTITSWIVCLSHFLLATTILLYLSRPLNPLFFQYALTIILASLLLNNRATLFMTILASFSFLVIAFRQIPEQGIVISVQNNDTVTILTALIVTTLLMNFARQTLNKGIELAKHQQSKLVIHQATLQRKQTSLQDEVGDRTASLDIALKEAEEIQTKLAEQLWLVEGETQLNDIMKGRQSVSQLAYHIMAEICRYLEVPMGSLFLREAERFIWYGGFAYRPKQKVMTPSLAQTAVNLTQPYTIRNTTDDMYLKSGLTKTNIPYLMLVPVHYRGQLVAIIQLGQLVPFTQQAQTYCQHVAQPIGVALHIAQTQQQAPPVRRHH